MMRRLILISSATATLLTVGCSSAEAICKSRVDQECERNHECQPDSVKSSDAFKAGWGSSVAECKTKLYTAAACSQKHSDDDNCHYPGETFDLDKAAECADARAKQSCADYLLPEKLPEVCTQVCQ
jgi:hypothetical protein